MDDRRLIPGHSPFEKIAGYSRVVVVGKHVYVAGTAPITRDGAPPPEDSYGQTRLCLDIIGEALGRAGSGFEHVVRTRAYLTDPAHFDGFARAHGEVFGDIRPVNTTVFTSLFDPAWKVEIDVDAVLP
jgi:enamine deaminase RidA (YjgF/YER057c/UK114 family)